MAGLGDMKCKLFVKEGQMVTDLLFYPLPYPYEVNIGEKFLLIYDNGKAVYIDLCTTGSKIRGSPLHVDIISPNCSVKCKSVLVAYYHPDVEHIIYKVRQIIDLEFKTEKELREILCRSYEN